MITNLTLENFRVFDELVTVRFRPITVLIGRNNAGKSSILKFLLMLQQSTGMTDSSDFLNPEGERVKLGDFDGLKNSKSKKDALVFGVDVKCNVPHAIEQVMQVAGAVGSRSRNRDAPANAVSLPPKGGVPRLVDVDFSYSAAVPYAKKQNGKQSIVAKSSSGFRLDLEQQISRAQPSFLRFTDMGMSNAVHGGDFTNVLGDFLKGVPQNDPKWFTKLPYRKSQWELAKSMYTSFYISRIASEITGIRHIAPIRQAFSRILELSSPPANYVGRDGKFAISHLKKLTVGKNKSARARAKIVLKYMEAVGDVERVIFKKSKDFKSDSYATVKARNSRTRASSYLADFGFGVSQILPVIVQGAIMPKGGQLMVEQPEAQLHPTAQLEMGSFFADIWKEFGVGSIIETHSNNILLRLRRLVANGTINKDDVSVAFFEIDEKGRATVKNLSIELDGSMEPDDLPMEFFHADILEGLELGAGE